MNFQGGIKMRPGHVIGFFIGLIAILILGWIADKSIARVDQATQETRTIEYYPPEEP